MRSQSMSALEIKNFSKSYGSTKAVDNLSLEIKQGEFFGFLGPNGAGKTTTINCVTGIGKFTEGTIKVFDIDVVKNYREARTKIGLSPQEFNVDIFMPIRQMLWYIGGYYGMTAGTRKKRIQELLEQFELLPHASKPFRALSGGLKRRVMIARAMVHDPPLLILDEPTAGLDVELRRDLWKYLQKINKAGKTILFTSHYLEEVEMLCNRIAVINKGRVVALGDKTELLAKGRGLEDLYLSLTDKNYVA